MPRCHMIGSHWFCGLFCSFSGSLLHPHQMLKYRVRLCSKTSTPQYLFLFKFWSWFLNKTPIRMANPSQRETRRLQQLRGVIFTTSFHWAGVITAAFLYVICLIRCPHSHLSNLSVKHWPNAKMRIKMWLTEKTDKIFLLTWEHHVFPEFVKWLITYFQHTCRSPMESDCPYNKKQGLMSMPFPLGWCDHSTHSSHGPNVEKRPFTIHIGRFVFQDLSESVKLFWNWNSYQGPFLPSSSCMTGMPDNREDKFLKKQVLIIQVSRKTGGVTTDTWALCFPSWLLLESFSWLDIDQHPAKPNLL